MHVRLRGLLFPVRPRRLEKNEGTAGKCLFSTFAAFVTSKRRLPAAQTSSFRFAGDQTPDPVHFGCLLPVVQSVTQNGHRGSKVPIGPCRGLGSERKAEDKLLNPECRVAVAKDNAMVCFKVKLFLGMPKQDSATWDPCYGSLLLETSLPC